MREQRQRLLLTSLCFASVLLMAGCAAMAPPPLPDMVLAPTPIDGNSGAYMCPYTKDGVVAEWVDKALNAKLGSTIGQTAGAYAGAKAMEQVPFVGGFLGAKVGEKLGREVAITASGGWDFIKRTSDQSFNNANDMAVFIYAKYSTTPHYAEALNATYEIYPELKQTYFSAIQNAPRK